MAKQQPATNQSGSDPAAGSSPAPQTEAGASLPLSLEIPVLNADQVKASSPEAVGQLKQEGKTEADTNLKALQAAFPGEEKFVLECQTKGLNVEQAKAAKFDAVNAELAQSKLKVAELEAKAATNQSTAPVVTFAAGDKNPDGTTKAPVAGKSATEDEWQAKAAQVWQKNPHLATEFENQGDFLAYFKRRPNEDYSKRKD